MYIPMMWYWLLVAAVLLLICIIILLICIIIADHFEKEALRRKINKSTLERIKAERVLEHARKYIRKI